MHAHRNMEIVSIPLRGGLEHRDSMGHVSVLHKGEVQVMSAGTAHHPEENEKRLWIYQRAWFSIAKLDKGKKVHYRLYNADSFGVYLFVINGAIDAESYALEKRDGIGIGDAEEFDITAREDSTVLLIEVPPVE